MPQYSFQITIASDKSEAERIAIFYQANGIPVEVVPDPIFTWSINTNSMDNLHRAIPIQESCCQIINVATGETVRRATWDKE